MFRPESFAPDIPYASSGEGTRYANPLAKLDALQIEVFARIFSGALDSEPRLVHMIPNPRTREAVLPWLAGSAIRAAGIYGETFIAPSADGGAIWIRPGGGSGFQQMLRGELRRLPFKLPKPLVKRWLGIHTYLDRIHQQLGVKPHWYLLILGSALSASMNAMGAVIEPVLARADFEDVECYVETFLESTLAFYEEHGFRIQGSGRITRSGPNFWIMVRKSRP